MDVESSESEPSSQEQQEEENKASSTTSHNPKSIKNIGVSRLALSLHSASTSINVDSDIKLIAKSAVISPDGEVTTSPMTFLLLCLRYSYNFIVCCV